MQIRSKSPNKKCQIRQDKLFIDNQMYVYDEDRHEVTRYVRPSSPPRPTSRNYSAVDHVLRRSTSVHSVNGEANGMIGECERSQYNKSEVNVCQGTLALESRSSSR